MFTKANNWLRGSVTVKMLSIIFLMLLLLIPLSMIQDVIEEREELHHAAQAEVGAKWSGHQTIIGPILTIPVVFHYASENGPRTVTEQWHILPERYSVAGHVQPKTLSRGIYEVIVYHSTLQLSGTFTLPPPPDRKGLHAIEYDKATLSLGISDLKGIDNLFTLQWQDDDIRAQPGVVSAGLQSGIHFNVPLEDTTHPAGYAFAVQIDLQGSQQLAFTPVGNHTQVKLTSTWNSPSFNGTFLPDYREVTDTGFTASWEILELNRNFPAQWMGLKQFLPIEEAAFGVELIQPADDYQKSLRSSKYAVMTIALTFLAFFLVEILNRWRIHPLQYALIGLALTLFYILLVSISEFMSFNIAYAIAAGAIILLITLYSTAIVRKSLLNILLGVVLIAIYGFVFVTLQLQDYALLIGSIGLVTILALTMYLTRKIDWYRMKIGQDTGG